MCEKIWANIRGNSSLSFFLIKNQNVTFMLRERCEVMELRSNPLITMRVIWPTVS